MVVGTLFTPALGGLVIGFALMLMAATAKNERWQLAYGVVSLIFVFWALGFFAMGRVYGSTIPALAMLFGLFSVYSKGSAQLVSIMITIVLFYQVII
jgi:hypothetical protein